MTTPGFHAQLRGLITRHCGTLRADAEHLFTLLNRLEPDAPALKDILADALVCAHTIKGSSGTIGFDTISTAAQALETQLRDLCNRTERPRDNEIAAARTQASTLADQVRGIRPEQSKLYVQG